MISFRFLTIKVNIHPPFWLFFLFFTGMYRTPSLESLVLGGILIVSILVHEYGHGFAVLYCGAQPVINLQLFGGNARYDATYITDTQNCFITLCGPLLESVLIIVPYLLLEGDLITSEHVQYILSLTMKWNMMWCSFNLLPVYPLDGGQISRYLLTRTMGQKGLKFSLLLGVLAAATGAVYFLLEGYFIFGGMMLVYGIQSIKALKKRLAPHQLS